MSKYKMIAAMGVIFTSTFPVFAQSENTRAFERPSIASGLGDHVARRTLNMNGQAITNLADPFYPSDAVNLNYLERNSGWDHKARENVDMDGFDLINIGDVVFDKSTLLGGVLESNKINSPLIEGGSMSGISMRNVSIEIPTVTGGTFQSPAILGSSIDQALVTNSEINNSLMSNVEISDANIIGLINLDNGRITGLPSPQNGSDAMNLDATRELIHEVVESLLDEFEINSDEMNKDMPSESIESMMDEMESMKMDRMAGMPIDAMPNKDNILGILDGGDILSAMRKLEGVAYEMPNGDLSFGIDPSTIPEELSFILRSFGEDESYIDYSRLIGPLVAVMIDMDRRITELETAQIIE